MTVNKYESGDCYEVRVYPRPYSPKSPKFETWGAENPVIVEYKPDGYRGNMAIIVELGKIRAVQGKRTGTVSVFDEIGNKVVDNESLEFRTGAKGKKGVLIWTWDGRNLKGRTVAAGSYLAVITVTNESDNITRVFREKIGITIRK
jgi:hypothetical protein